MRAYVRLFVCQIEKGIECRVARYLSDVLNVKGKRTHWREGGGGGGVSEGVEGI